MSKYIGIDLGGTKCAVILASADSDGITVNERVSIPTGADVPPYVILSKIEDVIASFGSLAPVKAVGISCGGPIDPKKGVVLCPPNLPLWDNINICGYFAEKLSLPVYMRNDADACALAEWKYGAGKGSDNMIFLTFGTGLGAGLILGGKLYSGQCSMAGEVGHIRLDSFGPAGCGKAGSFEGFCSGSGIAQLGYTMGVEAFERGVKPSYFIYGDPSSCTAKSIAEAAHAGDKTALAVFRKSGEYLGRGLSILIDILNPEKIVIGSVFARAKDLILPAALEVIVDEAIPRSAKACEIVPAALGDAIGDYAAISIAVSAEEDK